MTHPDSDSSLPSTSGELIGIFARMTGLLLDSDAVANALSLVTQLAAEAMPGTAGAGVTLIDDAGNKVSAAATDDLTLQCDALQYELNIGPCLAASAGRIVVSVEDIATDRRWPQWSVRAAELGLASALSVPLLAPTNPLGAIKVYSRERYAFSDQAVRLLSLFSQQAAVLITNAQAFERANRLSSELKASLHSRDTVAIARGVLMAKRNVDQSAAFTMLVSAARQEGTSLLAVAERIVGSTARRPR